MGYDKTIFYSMLRKDSHDRARAQALENAYQRFTDDEKAWCDRAILNLMTVKGIGVQQARALVASAVILYHMKVDEQDQWRAHGEYVRSVFEWVFAGKKIEFEDVPA